MFHRYRWSILVGANAVLWCVLGFCQRTTSAERTGGELPFANSVVQRNETIAELKEIKELLKEQNELLKGGKLKVVLTLPEQR